MVNNNMNNLHTKPKLVYFQYKYDERLPEFLLIHKREHAKCLSLFFDIIVVHEDCDYQQICDKYHPDLALFESGVNHETCRRLKIENIRACPEIPKIALHNADGFCNARAGFLSDMDHWGIETFFSISITAAEHTPEIADNLFTWPVFVDDEIYRDYGSWKSIPILLNGNRNQFYPWRRKIFKLVSENYPSLNCHHPGYQPRAGRAGVIVGKDYARTINASWFVPACGTVAKEVVRKHFEIPASNACLIAEKSPGLEAAGFIDMTNCVFADEHDVLDKLDYLFKNPDVVERITTAGYQLAHSRHAMQNRSQMLQWFNLQKDLKPNQRIIQGNPFEQLFIVQKDSGIKTAHIISNGLHLTLLRQGDELLMRGKYDDAERCYLKCISYMRWMPEPKLRMAICNLYKGNAKQALTWLDEPINFILFQYKSADPDPVEWAYYIITLLCLGKPAKAIKHASEFPWIHHPELNRARLACNIIKNSGFAELLINDDMQKRRYSMHHLPDRDLREWIEQLCTMLGACGQSHLAEPLTGCLFSKGNTFQGVRGHASAAIAIRPDEENFNNPVSKRSVTFFEQRTFIRKLSSSFMKSASDILHRLEAKYGYFLPYHISESRNDEFYKSMRELMRDEEIKTALAIGAVIGESSTEAFLAGAQENERKPSVYCISNSKRRYVKRKITKPIAKWYKLSFSRSEELTEDLEKTIENIKKDNQIKSFDAVLIDGSELKNQFTSDALEKELHSTQFVLLDDINSRFNHQELKGFLRDSSFSLVTYNPDLRNGYAIFKKFPTEGELCQ